MEQSLKILQEKTARLNSMRGNLSKRQNDIEKRLSDWERDRNRRLEKIDEKIRSYSELLNEITTTVSSIDNAESEVQEALRNVRQKLSQDISVLELRLKLLESRQCELKGAELDDYTAVKLRSRFMLLIEDSEKITDAAEHLLNKASQGEQTDENMQEQAEQLIRYTDYWLARIPYECGQTSGKIAMPSDLPTGDDKVLPDETPHTVPTPPPAPRREKSSSAPNTVKRTVGAIVGAVGDAVSDIDTEDDCPRWGGLLALLVYAGIGALSGYLFDLGMTDDVFNPLGVMLMLGLGIYLLWFGVIGSFRVMIARSFTVGQVLCQIAGAASFTAVFWLLKLVQIWVPETALCITVYILFVMAPLVAVSCVDLISEEISDNTGDEVMVCVGALWLLLTAIVIGAFSVSGWGEEIPVLVPAILSQIAFLLALIAPFRLFASDHRFWGTVTFLLPLLFMIMALGTVAVAEVRGIAWFIFADLAVFVLSIFIAFKYID